MSEEKVDYVTQFIIQAGRVPFDTADGRKWLMRQPTPEESADGNSAYRLTYNSVLSNKRLVDLAGDEETLKREARIRAAAAEVIYMVPLLLESAEGMPAYNVFDAESMAEFESLDPTLIIKFTEVYWGPIQEAIQEAKKKYQLVSSAKSNFASTSINGPSQMDHRR